MFVSYSRLCNYRDEQFARLLAFQLSIDLFSSITIWVYVLCEDNETPTGKFLNLQFSSNIDW